MKRLIRIFVSFGMISVILSLILGCTTAQVTTNPLINSKSPPVQTQQQSASTLSLRLVNITSSQPYNGWIQYEAVFAITNNGNSSLYISDITADSSPTTQYGLPVAAFASTSPQITTKEGQTYTGTLNLRQSDTLYLVPPHMAITGDEATPFSVSFQVPELLHASQAIFSPGISINGAAANSLSLDLTAPLSSGQSLNTKFPQTVVPATINIGTAEMTINPSIIGSAGALYWLPEFAGYNILSAIDPTVGRTQIKISYSVQNASITADQPLDFSAQVVDMNGAVYFGSKDPGIDKVGPGQNIQGTLIFSLPGQFAIDQGVLALSITGLGAEKTVAINEIQWTNGIQSPTLPTDFEYSGYTTKIGNNQTLNVPGQVSGTVNNGEWARIIFQANKGMTINISIVPEPKSNWFLVLCDPSGKKILRTYYPPSEDNPDPTDNWPKSTGIRIAFDGNYSLYITGPDAFSHSYTVDINTSNSIPSSTTSAVTDDQLIAQAQQAAQSKVQPANYTSCLVYAQARGLGVTAKGNTGAFNILYQGDDAKLVNNSPTSQLKTGIISLNNAIDLTTILHPGDFIVWQRGVAQADSTYGHIAVVELVEANRLVISQSDWSPAWKVLHTSDFVSGMYGYPLGLQ